MRLSSDAVLIELGGVPMAGNPETGALVGLTEEGEALCRELSERDVSPAEVAPGCLELVDALGRNGLLEGAPGARRGLDSAYLHVTQRCNLACRHCYSEGDDRNRAADPSLAQLRRAVALLASLGCARLVISGGEPFLRGDLADVASFARDRGVGEVVVLTNGLLVDEKGIDPLVGLVSCVAVAFDGASADAPAPLRGTQRFGRLVRAVETIRDAGIEARILPTLHAGNLDEVPRCRRLADELGASLSFSLLTAPADELGDLRLSDEQLHELGRRPPSDGAPCGLAGLSARRSCGAGTRTLSVAADGTIYPCHMLHDRSLALGSAFSDLPRAPVPPEPRVDDVDGCAGCRVRYLCGGGCRARALMATGSLFGRDPYCELSRSHYEELGRQLARRFGTRGGDGHAV